MPYSEQRPTTHFGRKFKNWKFSFKDNETIENIKKKTKKALKTLQSPKYEIFK